MISSSLIIYFLSKKFRKNIYIIFAIWSLLYFTVIFDFVFQKIPQFLGGVRPIVTTIIGTKEQITYLNNFGVQSFPNGKDNSVQTLPFCMFYQNDNYIIFGFGKFIVNSDGSIGAWGGGICKSHRYFQRRYQGFSCIPNGGWSISMRFNSSQSGSWQFN